MKSLCEEYLLADTIDEALQALTAAQGTARLLSGGTDLLLEIQQGSSPPVHMLIDVSEIEEMQELEIRDDSLFIGASVTLARLANSTLVRKHAQALAEAAALMGNPQVGNVATIGGNVAHALPAADGSISLLALEAQAEVACVNGRRRVPLQALFKGPRESTLDAGNELLVGFYIPLCKKGQASAFSRRIKPQGVPLAIVNMAIWVSRNGERVVDARIAAGPSGPVPLRIKTAESELIDQYPSSIILERTLEKLLEEAHFRTSPHRASDGYRRHLADVLLHEAFSKAWMRARENSN